MASSYTLRACLPFLLTFFLPSQPLVNTAADAGATCNLPPSAATAASCPAPSRLILDACNGTARLSGLDQTCIQALTSDHRTASAATAAELAKAAVAMAVEMAERTKKLIGSPKKPVFKGCAESYNELVEALKKVERWLRKADVDEADIELGGARDAADYCNLLLTVDQDDKKSPVFAANKEVADHIIFAMSAADLL